MYIVLKSYSDYFVKKSHDRPIIPVSAYIQFKINVIFVLLAKLEQCLLRFVNFNKRLENKHCFFYLTNPFRAYN